MIRLTMLAALGLLFFAFGPSPAVAAEEFKMQATATWQSQGRVYFIGEEEALFVGGFSGIMFVDDGEGSLNAAKLVCPGMMEINMKTDRESGEGRCIITTQEGHRVFAKWRCDGVAMEGCAGDFALVAGTGPFQGISGGGPFILRSAMGNITADLASGDVDTIGLGIAAWPLLTVKLP